MAQTRAQFADWLADQPKKHVVVKVALLSEKGRVLLVKPTYKKGWQFPGGGVDAHEDPKNSVLRELREELGLDLQVKGLRLVDSITREVEDELFLMYEYTEQLSEDMTFTLQAEEIENYSWEESTKVAELVSSYYTEFIREHLSELGRP